MKIKPTFRIDQGAKCVKKPSMAVEFLLILLFQAEDDLNGTRVHGGLPSGGAENTGGVLEDVRSDGSAIHGVFSDTFLVAAHLRGESGTDVED
jgi:hypothetical protein